MGEDGLISFFKIIYSIITDFKPRRMPTVEILSRVWEVFAEVGNGEKILFFLKTKYIIFYKYANCVPVKFLSKMYMLYLWLNLKYCRKKS